MNKKIKFVSAAATLALAATMALPAFAEAPEMTSTDGTIGGAVPTDNGTQVWAGVAVDNPDMRIKVTVPTLFAFVVNGTVDTTAGAKAVTVENDGLLLPNVKVTNVQGTTAGSKYDISTVGESTLKFENFSTYLNSGNREGLKVEVTGSIRNEGTEDSRHGWTHIGTKPSDTAAQDVKKYRLTVDDQPFVPQEDGSFGMNAAVEIAAPDVTSDSAANLDPTTQLAKTGAVHEAEFGVQVGGTRGDYKTVEESAKVGTISWMVSAEATVPATPGS